jgi:hypothetical protein
MADALLVRLAREELVYILRALQIDAIPGLGPQPLGPLTSEQRAAVMDMADRTLRARGIVIWQDAGAREVNASISGLIRTYAQPRFTFALTVRQGEQMLPQTLIAFATIVAVEMFLAEPGVHQFYALKTPAEIRATVTEQLRLDAAVPAGGDVVQFSQGLWQQIADAQGTDRAALLAKAHLPAPLAQALAQPTLFVNCQLWQGFPAGTPETWSFVQSAAGTWQIMPTGNVIAITPISPVAAETLVADRLQPALDLLRQPATP